MSGEPILITLSSSTGASTALPVVLKKIMEMPPPNILEGDDGTLGPCDWVERERRVGVAFKRAEPELTAKTKQERTEREASQYRVLTDTRTCRRSTCKAHFSCPCEAPGDCWGRGEAS